jgi:hypothetical protein
MPAHYRKNALSSHFSLLTGSFGMKVQIMSAMSKMNLQNSGC